MANPVVVRITDFKENAERVMNLAMAGITVSITNFRSNLFHIVPDKEYTRLKENDRLYKLSQVKE